MIVRPLRRVRKRLKEGFRGIDEERLLKLRREIKAIEIDSEHIEQLFLGETFAPGKNGDMPVEIRAGHAAANLAGYLPVSGMAGTAGHLGDFRTLLAASFPDLEGGAVDAVMAAVWAGKSRNLWPRMTTL